MNIFIKYNSFTLYTQGSKTEINKIILKTIEHLFIVVKV